MLYGMNGLTLTSSEIIALKQAHRACKDKRAADRIKAVYSLGVGFSVEDVVDILMLDAETLRNYVKRYQSGGIKALIADHYQGSVSKLSAIQLNELNAHLEQNTYLTVEAIIAHVYEQYDVSYTVSGMTDLLHRLKFTYKKSKLVPACPDHTEKAELFTLLNAETNTGITLTETFAMNPASSVSGLYFAHPAAKYFVLGKICRDQVEDYARRKGMNVKTAEKWLAPVLNYDPE